MHIFAILISLSLSASHCIAYQIRGEQPQNWFTRRGDLGAHKAQSTSKPTFRRKRKAETSKGDPPAAVVAAGHEVKSGRTRKIDHIQPHLEQQPTTGKGDGQQAPNPDLGSLTIAERRGRPTLTQNLGDLNNLSRFKDPVPPERTGIGLTPSPGPELDPNHRITVCIGFN